MCERVPVPLPAKDDVGVPAQKRKQALRNSRNLSHEKVNSQLSRDGNEPESCESSRVRVPKSEFFVGFCEFESSRVKKKCEFELESQVS